MDEPSFFPALQNALGDRAAKQHRTVIGDVAAIVDALVTHSNQVILNVIKAGDTIPVITFNVSQTDVLQGFRLGISEKTQTLKFASQIVLGLTTTKFIKSSVSWHRQWRFRRHLEFCAAAGLRSGGRENWGGWGRAPAPAGI